MASYEQNKKSKLWSVRFRETNNGQEHHKRLSGYKTKREAQTAYIEYQAKAKQQTTNEPPERPLFTDIVERYLEHSKGRMKEGTIYDLQLKIQKHILPFFGDRYIDEIKPVDILSWQRSIDGYSYSYKSGLRSCLGSIYKYADRYHDIKNIMNKVEPFRNMEPPQEMQCWTKEEFLQFLSACEGEIYKTYFYLLYITGCRKGEILALTWNDIDLSQNTISINKNITKKAEQVGWAVTTTKNKSSNRIIDISPKNSAVLKKYKAWQKEHYKNTSFLFCGDRPIPMTNIGRYFEKAIAKSGVKKIRIHDLRHSCASLLISKGVSIVAVSRRLGHKNIEQTLNTYSHMMPEDNQKILQIFEEI